MDKQTISFPNIGGTILINKKFGFIGGGAMAEALISGFIQSGLVQAEQVFVSDVNDQRLRYLADRYGVMVHCDNKQIVDCDVLFLTVKPNVVELALKDIANRLIKDTLIVSVAAGITTGSLEKLLPHSPIIRVMPNTPVSVRAGMSAIALGTRATAGQGEMVADLFGSVGETVILQEDLIDAVTGLSGSGPGYGFVLIDALADAGVRVGLPRKTSILLAAQTLFGAAKMVLETNDHPAVLRDSVTSPGGTTAAGIHMLEQGGVRAALSNAVYAACSRSKEMGKNK